VTRARQIWAWTRFILSEYVRSGRILVELAAAVAFIWIFLRRPNDAAIMDANHFFSLTALFVLAQTIYTATVVTGLGQRAQGYVVLARPLGRRGYLLGLFLAPVIVGSLMFVVMLITVSIINTPQPADRWTPLVWLAGGLPLLLDVALVSAITLLLSGLVLTQGWRLLVLGFVALALLGSAELFTTTISPTSTGGRIMGAAQALLGMPLTPLLAGFELAVRRLYSTQAVAIIAGQMALLFAVLAFAMFAFDRRDVVLN
jgi:hypothetical protein